MLYSGLSCRLVNLHTSCTHIACVINVARVIKPATHMSTEVANIHLQSSREKMVTLCFGRRISKSLVPARARFNLSAGLAEPSERTSRVTWKHFVLINPVLKQGYFFKMYFLSPDLCLS